MIAFIHANLPFQTATLRSTCFVRDYCCTDVPVVTKVIFECDRIYAVLGGNMEDSVLSSECEGDNYNSWYTNWQQSVQTGESNEHLT